ncbi:alpha/beta fold hydrolase [Desulfosarcina sp. OttesenSCG-928-G17]|nr:alpha/beta fold hydrolase [Desulfosarcina sp. OttesenSCG-928-G17]
MTTLFNPAPAELNALSETQPAGFDPPFFLKPAGLQTLLASAGIRATGPNPMAAAAQPKILTTTKGIRLMGLMSRQPRPHQKGLVILLHGWEGSTDSTYIRVTGRFLFGLGYDVFRLNFRDHGPTHHLNTGIFYAVLLDEVFDAVRQIADAETGRPVFLAGFSLGGNFALRIARQCAVQPISTLGHIMAISPVLNPDKATDRIDKSPLILRYFLRKWRRSLAAKQRYFPDLYDFSDLMGIPSLREMTERLLARHSTYTSAKTYFDAYGLMETGLGEIRTPTTVITAKDDPIIPVEDFYTIKTGSAVRLRIQPHGGHNGFLGQRLKPWYEDVMAACFR